MTLDSALLAAPVPDHRRLDLRAAERVRYVLEQSFRYEYDAPVRQLRHRLVIVPPARHGSQRRLAHRLEITGARARRRLRRDADGNVVAFLQAESVPHVIEFKLAALVRAGLRRWRAHGASCPGPAQHRRLLRPTRLTAANDPHLRAGW